MSDSRHRQFQENLRNACTKPYIYDREAKSNALKRRTIKQIAKAFDKHMSGQ